MIAVRGESFILKRYPRKPNSPYEWSDVPDVTFFGRPATPNEIKNYRIQAGVHGSQESVFIYVTNLPKEIQVGDKLTFKGDEWTVQSVGYYYEDTRVVTSHLMSDDYIIERCPKGITLA